MCETSEPEVEVCQVMLPSSSRMYFTFTSGHADTHIYIYIYVYIHTLYNYMYIIQLFFRLCTSMHACIHTHIQAYVCSCYVRVCM